MIPKTIHYCWFGRNPKPKLAKKCIRSWKRYCPDYQIIEWNEDNFDISACPLYVRQAYEAKKWAFVTDYVRLKVVYDHGGIYLDTDVEAVKSFDSVLQNKAFFGFEYGEYVATGLGFGAEKHAEILREMMDDYEDIPFILEDCSENLITCPVRNTQILLKYGLKMDDTKQVVNECLILPSEYLCPYNGMNKRLRVTENTISIHWYSGSWGPKEREEKQKQSLRRIKYEKTIDCLFHLPNHIMKLVLGDRFYSKLKRIIKELRIGD